VTKDISRVLQDWDFEPDETSVRIVHGEDGRELIQLRLDLGLLQMEVSGRPDRQRPHGFESWLDYLIDQQARHDASEPDGAAFELTSEHLGQLLREGIQYYHRYLSLWHLDRYEECARDTLRNLKLFEFVRLCAANESDKMQFDQWRPYVTMMHARAVATPLIDRGDKQAASAAIQQGIEGILEFLEEYGQQERAEQCAELVQLQRWQEELNEDQDQDSDMKSGDGIQQLQVELEQAILTEQYEEAALLRDRIRQLSSPGDDGDDV
jgi:hypothetical protein